MKEKEIKEINELAHILAADMNKEPKAKEYARLEAQRFYDPNTSPEYYERLVETMENIFEAGKQEGRKTLIAELKNWAKKDFEEFKRIFPGDWNSEDETFSLEIILDKLTELENLSK